MTEFLIGAISALWLGIMTSISPCPLTTNIVAISYIGRRASSPRLVVLSGLLYMIGRAFAYTALAMLLVASMLSAPGISHILQKYMNKLLGPVLIIAGMFLLQLLRVKSSCGGVSDSMQNRVESHGLWGAGLLGIVLALSFCPVSAALFFGSLLPLAMKFNSPVAMPALYGVGTALPVMVFAVLMSLGANSIGKAFDGITKVERWIRIVTGWVFVGVGTYLSLAHIYGLSLRL